MSDHSLPSGKFRFDPLSALWRIAASPQALMALLALVGLALALGITVPQIPDGEAQNPQAWLAAQPGATGPFGGLIDALRLYDLFHAFWFHLLLVLVGLALFVWTVDAAELAWLATKRRSWAAGDLALWGRAAPQASLSTDTTAAEAQTRLETFLTENRYRWVALPNTSLGNLVAGRRGLFLWAWPVALGAVLAALLGLAIVANWGWQNGDWTPADGDELAVGHEQPLTVRLDRYGPPQESGDLDQQRSQITWLPDGGTPVQDVAVLGHPARFEGVALRQMGHVPIVQMSVRDASGRSLALQTGGDEPGTAGAVEVAFASAEDTPLVFLADRDLFLALDFEPRCSDGGPALRVDLLGGGGQDRQTLGTLQESGTVMGGGLQVDVDLAYRPILRVDHRPAVGLVVAGMALAVAALTAGWLASPRFVRLVVASSGDGTRVQILVPSPLRGNRWLWGLVAQLQEALADGD